MKGEGDQQNMRNLTIATSAGDGFVDTTVFHPDDGDNGNQYLFMINAEQGITVVPALCRDDRVALLVTGDWEAAELGESILRAMEKARTMDRPTISVGKRDWLINEHTGKPRMDPSEVERLFDKSYMDEIGGD